jgi:hypothetical protein
MFYDQHAGDEYDSNAGVGVLASGKRRSNADVGSDGEDDSEGVGEEEQEDDDEDRGDVGTMATSDSTSLDSNRQSVGKKTDKSTNNRKK